jgi:hypothetical protein
MDARVSNMERWRGDTLYRVTHKGARIVLRKRTKHLPKSRIMRAHNRGYSYE